MKVAILEWKSPEGKLICQYGIPVDTHVASINESVVLCSAKVVRCIPNNNDPSSFSFSTRIPTERLVDGFRVSGE